MQIKSTKEYSSTFFTRSVILNCSLHVYTLQSKQIYLTLAIVLWTVARFNRKRIYADGERQSSSIYRFLKLKSHFKMCVGKHSNSIDIFRNCEIFPVIYPTPHTPESPQFSSPRDQTSVAFQPHRKSSSSSCDPNPSASFNPRSVVIETEQYCTINLADYSSLSANKWQAYNKLFLAQLYLRVLKRTTNVPPSLLLAQLWSMAVLLGLRVTTDGAAGNKGLAWFRAWF